MTQGNNRITRRKTGKETILMVTQKPEIYLQMRMCGQRDTLWNTLWHTAVSMMRFFSMLLFFVCRREGEVARAKGRNEGKGISVGLFNYCSNVPYFSI